MSGFLDKNTTVLDMALTGYGKELLANGKFNVEYFALFDDEVDYDPFINNSGSLTATQLTASKIDEVEMTLVREVTSGMLHGRDMLAFDRTNVNKPLFTMPQGQKTLPVSKYNPTGSLDTVRMTQRKVVDVYNRKDALGNVLETIESVRGYEIVNGSKVTLNMSIDDFFDFGADDGYMLRVYFSGSKFTDSNGYVEIPPKRDFENVLSYEDLVRVLLDGEIEHRAKVEQNRIVRSMRDLSVERKS